MIGCGYVGDEFGIPGGAFCRRGELVDNGHPIQPPLPCPVCDPAGHTAVYHPDWDELPVEEKGRLMAWCVYRLAADPRNGVTLPGPRRCLDCGCTEYDACVDWMGESCGWSERWTPLCTFCAERFDFILRHGGSRDSIVSVIAGSRKKARGAV